MVVKHLFYLISSSIYINRRFFHIFCVWRVNVSSAKVEDEGNSLMERVSNQNIISILSRVKKKSIFLSMVCHFFTSSSLCSISMIRNYYQSSFQSFRQVINIPFRNFSFIFLSVSYFFLFYVCRFIFYTAYFFVDSGLRKTKF